VFDSLFLSGFIMAFAVISLSILTGFVERNLDVILPRLLTYLHSKITLLFTVFLFLSIYIGSFFWGKEVLRAPDRETQHQVADSGGEGKERPL
jgi:choline-glycine betaine transporter